MAIIKIAVQNNRAALLGSIELIAGTIGQKCKFYFDEEWRSLPKKNIIYRLGSTIIANDELVEDEATIPPKALITAGLPLAIGITGYTIDKSIVKPTSWCNLGCIKEGSTYNFIDNDDAEEDQGTHIIYDGGVIS